MKNNLISGTLIKIPLEFELGFVLAKLIKLKEIVTNPTLDFLVYVYEKVFKYDSDINFNDLDSCEYLLGGVFVLDLTSILKINKWEIIGYHAPNSFELTMPDFKDFGPSLTLYEKDAKCWYCINNYDVNNRILVDYSKIKHLEKFVYYSHDIITRRLTMEVIRQSASNIKDYYRLEKWEELAPYYNMIYTPIFKSIAKAHRGIMRTY